MQMVTTVMLRDEEAALLEAARNELFFKGMNRLDPDIQAAVKKKMKMEGASKLTKGVVVAIASSVLMALLERGE